MNYGLFGLAEASFLRGAQTVRDDFQLSHFVDRLNYKVIPGGDGE